ncbi:hypothetical protein GCM10027048_15500 [Hymenobacter coalescens]
MNKTTGLLLSFGLMAAACQEVARQEPLTAEPPAITPVAAAPKALVLDTVQLPKATDAVGQVLQTGDFHDGEIPPDAARRHWLGLFRGAEGYYLAGTAVRTARTFDVVQDDEGQQTGWKVSLPDTNRSCLLLLAGLRQLASGPVDSAAVGSGPLEPGKPVHFRLGGVRYTLTARCDYAAYVPDDQNRRNYKLYLASSRRPGVEQLLAAAPQLDDAMITLLWAGDLDHDGQADLILDTAPHYNASRLSLYLSSLAAGSELVKFVGLHETVGC